LFDPLNEHQLAVCMFTCLKLVADEIYKLIKIKEQSLVKRSVDHVFELVVHLFGVLFDIILKCHADEINYLVKDVQEVRTP